MAASLADCNSFRGLQEGHEHDDRGTAYVHSANGNTLRIDGYCMINGYPCKIKELNWAAPGKHGSSKVRTVGYGIFDGKKRETIFRAQHPVNVPVIQKYSDVLYVVAQEGIQVESKDVGGLVPSLLPYISIADCSENAEQPEHGKHLLVSIIITCGHYKITDLKVIEAPKQHVESEEDTSKLVLSKKEARKLKKQKRKDMDVLEGQHDVK